MRRPIETDQRPDHTAIGTGRGLVGAYKALALDSLIVAAAGAFLAFVAFYSSGGPQAAHNRYITAPITRGTLTVKVHATGTVEPTRLIDVSTEQSGTVRRVLIKTNDVVMAGQVLAELDPSQLRAQVSRARAVVAAAKARLQEASADVRKSTADLGRKQRLHAGRFASERDLDAAEFQSVRASASADRLKAEIEMAEADLQIAEANLAKSRIVSPVNGVVLRRSVEPGQTIAASLQPPVLFRIAEDLTEMQIRVDVDEADSMNVEAGQSATFAVQALRNKRFAAKVERIHIGPEIVQGVVTYKAILTFDNRRIRLKPGMTASADISVERVRNALLVPNAALRFSPAPELATLLASGAIKQMVGSPAAQLDKPGDTDNSDERSDATPPERHIHVLDASGLRRISVVVGPSDGVLTAVSGEGIAAGQRVVVDIADAGS